ncbi:cation-translocating P-type ATPase [Asticcacaulis taihuensis]|uniref:cation-translocating P-type ATPase n=1 Tax=Asticcacaulis taihuensis TaxID=260084 RepID=UPI0026E9EB1B|nr:cation-translocating P-type ATPase [Asticcacaulis taihuensis]
MSRPAQSLPTGLSAEEASIRLARDGTNELPRQAKRTPLRIALEVIREPMLALLIAGGVIYLVLGDLSEAVILMILALFSVVITVVQEARTERVLEALRDLTSPRALVIRDGQRERIAGREVVAGDLLVLSEGDRVPADGRVIECQSLQTDESLLTGESVPVRKVAAVTVAEEAALPGGDDRPYVFSGTMVVRGSGLAEVIATGPRSQIGRIGQSLGELITEPPRLKREMGRLVRVFAIGGGVISLLVMILYGLYRGTWLEALLAGIAVGMSMLPEEFPVVVTIFMAMGAWRISRARVLTRRAAAIETLGAATVLCTDKTGTLTENIMRVAELRRPDGQVYRASDEALPDVFHDLARFSILASAREPFDPMEKALHAFQPDGAVHQWQLVRAFGLHPGLLAMSNVWQTADDDELVVAGKGAPEAIAGLCGLDAAGRDRLASDADAMAAEGLRVLGVARATAVRPALPEDQRGFAFEFLGLVGLADTLRASAPAAVAECRTAGIRVVMITGDYPVTARAIATQAGIDANEIMTGDELAAMDDADLARRIEATTVFARIMPQQKLRIVEALKAKGEVVAMTGDGVNDAPTLKAAHIGIAMGQRGTDVAREASAIVLLDDDFGSIVKAIRLGRRIYDNLHKAVTFILAVHVPIAGLALLPLVFGLPILLGPVHIAFLEMIIDPVCTLVFEAETEEDDIMRRPPRDPERPMFSLAFISRGVIQGGLALGAVVLMLGFALRAGLSVDAVRAVTFMALVAVILSLVLVNRSRAASILEAIRRPNRALVLVFLAVAVVLTLGLALPFARHLFRFEAPSWPMTALALSAGVIMLAGLEGLKWLTGRWYRWRHAEPSPRAPAST